MMGEQLAPRLEVCYVKRMLLENQEVMYLCCDGYKTLAYLNMNLLLLRETDFVTATSVEIGGERARHMIEAGHARIGRVLTVGLVSGVLGKAEVSEATEDRVFLNVELGDEITQPIALHWIVALPRPQILKKVLQLAGMLRVQSVHFTRSEGVEKSYFASPMTNAENIQRELEIGMSQSVSTYLPKVTLYNRFLDLVSNSLVMSCSEGVSLLAHTKNARTLSQISKECCFSKVPRITLAIGPERGWNDFECEQFIKNGFQACSLGEPVLRVENAVCYLTAQVLLLKELSLNC